MPAVAERRNAREKTYAGAAWDEGTGCGAVDHQTPRLDDFLTEIVNDHSWSRR